jgi:UDP-glucose 4-epimerase
MRPMAAYSFRDKCVLVTGGAGFIGSYVVERLAQEGPRKVVVVDNLYLGKKENLTRAKELLGERLVTYWQDATDAKAMADIVSRENVQIAYDMAVIPLPQSLIDPAWNVRQNVELTLVLCELLRDKRFETLVHFSSSEAYGSAVQPVMSEDHPTHAATPYAASKLAGDALALSYGETFSLDVTVLRPFNNYGPRQNAGDHAGILPILVRKVLEGNPIEIFGDGEQTRDLICVRDTAEAAMAIYLTPGSRQQVVNVASGIETSVNTLVKNVLRILEKPNHPVQHKAPRIGDVRRHLGGVERAKKLWGFAPKIALEEGLIETVQWYAAQMRGGV